MWQLLGWWWYIYIYGFICQICSDKYTDRGLVQGACMHIIIHYFHESYYSKYIFLFHWVNTCLFDSNMFNALIIGIALLLYLTPLHLDSKYFFLCLVFSILLLIGNRSVCCGLPWALIAHWRQAFSRRTSSLGREVRSKACL